MANPHSDSEDANAAGTVSEHPSRPSRPSNRIVPEAVSQRFLRIDNRYFFPDRTLAFVDTGNRLKVRTHNLEVVHSIVAIMQARSWRTIQVSGTKEFRQKVWHEATMRGIGVQGYDPDPLEMQQLQRALDRDSTRHSHDPTRDNQDKMATRATPDDASHLKVAPTAPPHSPGTGLRPPTVGVLLAHAAAPYQFDPAQRMSYYVRIRTEVGERTLWGTDLERAISESRSAAQVGDEVVLTQRGARAVTVRVPARNAKGELVGDKKLAAQRMTWSVEKVQYLETQERKATVFKACDISTADVLAQFPDLTGAVAGMKLAEQFAQRLTSNAFDQARVVQAIRTGLANAIAQGQEIRLPAQRVEQIHVRQRTRGIRSLDDPQQRPDLNPSMRLTI
ncbi:LPD7 domain-containing protein [Variovorax robiniae]|uniref:LPD7 domain-containing protein n=1 Tax=Variovorax robiniae TaxID=1836199 RepID=A0ABU8XK16_9BURK